MPIVPVKKVTIITFSDFEEELLRDLGKLGVVDLRTLLEEEFAGFKKETTEDLHKYRELMDRLNALLRKISNKVIIKPYTREVSSKIHPMDIEVEISYYEKELGKIESEKSRLEKELKEIKELFDKIELLNKYGIKPGDIGIFEHIFVTAGIVKEESLQMLKSALSPIPNIIIKEYRVDKKKYLVTIACMNDFKDSVYKVLKATDYEEIILPKEISREYVDARKWATEKISQIEQRLKNLEELYEELLEKLSNEIGRIEKELKYSYTITLAQSKMLRSKMMVVLQGWIPEDRVGVLKRYFEKRKEVFKGRVLTSITNPEPHDKPPTVLRSKKLFSAYLSLVRQYGIPEPHETDPSLIAGILWTFMFGFMFPDLGQGLVIVLLGMLFVKMKRKELMGIPIKTIGKLMIGGGIVAAIFGALTGDFFLLEDVIEPLWPGLAPGWLEKASNVIWLIKIAVFLGIIEVSIGIIMSIRNHLEHHHTLEALLGEKGLAGLIAFWSIATLAFAFVGITVIPGIIEFPGIDTKTYMDAIASFNVVALFIWPNITLTFPVLTLLLSVIGMVAKGIIEKEEISMTIGLLFETMISFFSNMLSFIRLAGFNVAHVALAVVIAKILEANPNLGLAMLAGLNFFALTLELMIVMIQALRLVFYEFLTKFYKGTGYPFRPFILKY